MGFRFRKSFKAGPLRINVSKSGVGYSVGGKGFRYTKKAGGGTRTTYSIPGTGVSYVSETSGRKKAAPKQTPVTEPVSYVTSSPAPEDTGPKKPFYKRAWFWVLFVLLLASCGPSETGEPKPEDIRQSITEQIAAGKKVSHRDVIPLIESVTPDFVKEQEITFGDNAFTVNICLKGILDTATLAIGGDESSVREWLNLVEDVKAYSLDASNLLKSCGIHNVPVIVNVLNDKDSAFILLSVVDGAVVSDFVTGMLDRPGSETEAPPAPTAYDNPVFQHSAQQSNTYVVNTNTGKFHRPTCNSISDILSTNKNTFNGTRDDALARGYSPCGHCDP